MPIASIHIVSQLWGQRYIKLYADVVIPSLLASGNLPALAPAPSVYTIYTTAEDRNTRERHPNFARLTAAVSPWCQVEFSIISTDIDNPYETMSACHGDAIARAEQRDAAILFLQPDVVVGQGSLETVRRALEEGRRLVLAPGLRTCLEEVTAALAQHEDRAGAAAPTARELVALALRDLHPISLSLMWEDGSVNNYCSHLYWRIGPDALYARCAHMHPLMVWPQRKGVGFDHTIDWDYFYRACPDQDRWFVAATSDEVCLIELSDRAKFADFMTRVPATPRSLSRFLARASEQPHRALLRRPYLFQARDLTDGEWQRPHVAAEAVVEEALRLHGRPWYAKLFSEPDIVVAPIALMMSQTSDRLARLKRRHPAVGGAIYWTFRSLFLGMRPIYRMLGRLQR